MLIILLITADIFIQEISLGNTSLKILTSKFLDVELMLINTVNDIVVLKHAS